MTTSVMPSKQHVRAKDRHLAGACDPCNVAVPNIHHHMLTEHDQVSDYLAEASRLCQIIANLLSSGTYQYDRGITWLAEQQRCALIDLEDFFVATCWQDEGALMRSVRPWQRAL